MLPINMHNVNSYPEARQQKRMLVTQLAQKTIL